MVEPVNFQHTLARTQIAEKMQEAIKDQKLADTQAFAAELSKIEQVREKDVHETEQDKDGLKVREDARKQQDHDGEDKKKEQSATESPAEAPRVMDDPDHHIDITA